MKNLEYIRHPEQIPETEPQRQFYYMELARQYVSQLSAKKGRPLTACTRTFGCQMNVEPVTA